MGVIRMALPFQKQQAALHGFPFWHREFDVYVGAHPDSVTTGSRVVPVPYVDAKK
jgi:hypothetical protein